MVEYTSQQILDGINKGDQLVLKYVYNRFFDSVKSYVIANSGTKEDAFDLYQDALMVILEKTRSDDFKLTASFYTYLYKVCQIIWLNVLRERRSSIVSNIDLDNSPNSLSYDEVAEIERRALKEKQTRIYQINFKKLSKECQKMIKLLAKGFKVEVIMKKFKYKSMAFTYKKRIKCVSKLKELIRKDTD